jgi:outer membrane protein assembly factor BamA
VVSTLKRSPAVLESVLRACEENGYPFASVRLDSLEVIPKGIRASIVLDKGRLVRIDSIRIHGPEVVAPVFLYNYLGISPGDLYKESMIRRVDTRLRELPFVTTVRPSGVLFAEEYTRLDLFVDSRKASQFDGVIGLLQGSDDGKARLTGEAHLRLQNSFKRGETLEFDWRQLPPRSQDLKIHVRYPFLLNSPVGLDGSLKLYRRDTLFVDVEKDIGVIVSLKGNNYLKIFLNDKSSNLQSTAGLANVTVLPEYADVSVTGYGAGLLLEELDYRLNPRRGYRVEFSGGIGSRDIRKNSGINPAAYEGVQLRSTQYQAYLDYRLFIPLSGRSVAALQSRSAFIAGNSLFGNELFRIGGLRSLRGFDEESIFASAYSIGVAELRYLTDADSYLSAFFNLAAYENKSGNSYRADTPWGFGTGYTFRTRLGILSISYALGRQDGNPLMIRNGKVHFGIVNYF